ncbi:MAG: NAD kinase [Streptococcaceae bacterium]|nr:NAD kinase [Streptococcaceae bacterium]
MQMVYQEKKNKKIAIVSNRQSQSQMVSKILAEKLLKNHFPIDEKNPDVVISVGGDGTLLKAFHQFESQLDKVKFIGVHTGHLGFYTDWRDYEIAQLIENLLKDESKSVNYPILDIEIEFFNGEKASYKALNESTIRRVNRTLVGDIYISGNKFEKFRGDGLSVSTPTGSTAYNKSVGGAVIHPSIKAIQLTEIASLNNIVFRTLGSPIIIGEKDSIEIVLEEMEDYTITIDQLALQNEKIKIIKYKISKEQIQFAGGKHTHFWERVRQSFIGDDDDEI